SPLGRFLVDPAGTLRRAAGERWQLVTAALPIVLGGIVAVALVVLVVILVARRQRSRMGQGARLVTILAPPDVDGGGAEAFWRNLADLVRPRWRHLLSGPPHVGFEYAWSAAGLRISVWVPGVVPAGAVERAVEA